MKFLFLIPLILIMDLSFSQEIKYVKIDNTCEAGIKEAKVDIEKGIYKVLSYGLIIHSEQDLHDYYVQYVKEKYNVILGDGGCVVTDKSECYRQTMEEAVLEKFGKDFFEKTHQEALEKFNKLDEKK